MFRLVFFGSFQDYSVQVLEKLLKHNELFKVVAVVTTPPRPAGRDQTLTPTPTQVFAEDHNLPVYPLESLEGSPRSILDLDLDLDFLVVAGYGKLIPSSWLNFPKIAPVNVHFSLLPDYPGRCPAEWAILMGEKETGVTLIKMSPEFDKGEIIAQGKIPIYGPDARFHLVDSTDTRETLYKRLYDVGGDLTVKTLPEFASGKIRTVPQNLSRPVKYARQITREDGFVPFEVLKMAMSSPLQGHALKMKDYPPIFGEVAPHFVPTSVGASRGKPLAVIIERMIRAFAGWPGVWTLLRSDGHRNYGGQATSRDEKRLKVLSGHLEGERLVIDSLQVEGRSAISGKDAKNFLESLLG